MALGKATVTTGAVGPGSFPEIEGVGLFIGKVDQGDGAAQPIGVNTDLATLFGTGNLVDTLEDARANGGPRWNAWAIGHTDLQTWEDVIDTGLAAAEPEFIVVCTPVTAGAELTTMKTRAETLLGQARRVFFLAAFAGIDPGTQAWADYITAAQAITSGADHGRVMITPLLFGSELGAFAGRLAAEKVSRSPMRVKSGSVVNPGSKPVDSAGVELDLATLEALDTARFSVFQWYAGKEGIYFADGNTLEATGGDFPVIEWLRTTDKGARRVRLVAIEAIADDTVQNTPAGNSAFGARLAAPLRQMAAPGVAELKPLERGAITVEWIDTTTVKVYITVRPVNAPKDITVEINLDTSSA